MLHEYQIFVLFSHPPFPPSITPPTKFLFSSSSISLFLISTRQCSAWKQIRAMPCVCYVPLFCIYNYENYVINEYMYIYIYKNPLFTIFSLKTLPSFWNIISGLNLFFQNGLIKFIYLQISNRTGVPDSRREKISENRWATSIAAMQKIFFQTRRIAKSVLRFWYGVRRANDEGGKKKKKTAGRGHRSAASTNSSANKMANPIVLLHASIPGSLRHSPV